MESEHENHEKQKGNWHDKNYKHLLIIPAILMVLSIICIAVFYSQTGDFIKKDISLTGGTSITVQGNFDSKTVEADLSGKLEEISTREVYDLVTREKKALIIETKSDGDYSKQILEDYLGYSLTKENSSVEYTGSSLGQSFFKQLILAIIFAFTFMGIVVFFLFGKQKKIKFLIVVVGLITPILFFIFKVLNIHVALILSVVVLIFIAIISFKYNMPSFAVIISALADILMTLALVDLLGIKISSAGIIAFLMLIGYSVDTDILLTNRILKKEGSINSKIYRSFKTGMTMTMTSLIAFLVALIIVSSFSVILTQIFTILVIGLGFDMINTWITNVSLLKWYFGGKK